MYFEPSMSLFPLLVFFLSLFTFVNAAQTVQPPAVGLMSSGDIQWPALLCNHGNGYRLGMQASTLSNKVGLSILDHDCSMIAYSEDTPFGGFKQLWSPLPEVTNILLQQQVLGTNSPLYFSYNSWSSWTCNCYTPPELAPWQGNYCLCSYPF